jgi:transcriptional regulator with PAS, ATPase and Fis domain
LTKLYFFGILFNRLCYFYNSYFEEIIMIDEKKLIEKIKERYESYKERHKKSMTGRQFKNLVKTLMKMNQIYTNSNYMYILSLLRKNKEKKVKDRQTYFSFH